MEFPALSLVRLNPRLGAVCSVQRMHALCEVGPLNLPLNYEHLPSPWNVFIHARCSSHGRMDGSCPSHSRVCLPHVEVGLSLSLC